jgi:vacuolar-type H+-ATPase subunit B/Vma2
MAVNVAFEKPFTVRKDAKKISVEERIEKKWSVLNALRTNQAIQVDLIDWLSQ